MANNELATKAGMLALPPELEKQAAELDAVANTSMLAGSGAGGGFAQAFRVSQAVKQLQKMISPSLIDEHIMHLQGTSLGFRTDKDGKGGYPPEEIRDCLIEAIMFGVRPTGNEFNIITGCCYITRNGMARKVREFPGLTDLKMDFQPPRMVASGALVDATAQWLMDGQPHILSRTIPIRVNQGMGADAILGKAERKLLASVFNRISGSEITVSDGEVDDAVMQRPRETGLLPENLRPGTEPNRGHGNEDLDQVAEHRERQLKEAQAETKRVAASGSMQQKMLED